MNNIVEEARERARIRRTIRSETDRIADQLDGLCDEIERLEDIIRREAWIENAIKNNLEGPYVPWDNHMKMVEKLRAEVADWKRSYEEGMELSRSKELENRRLRAALVVEDGGAYIALMQNRNALAAENDRLLELLREARSFMIESPKLWELYQQIDTALGDDCRFVDLSTRIDDVPTGLKGE